MKLIKFTALFLLTISIANCSSDREVTTVTNPELKPDPKPDPTAKPEDNKILLPSSFELVKDSIWGDSKTHTITVSTDRVHQSFLQENLYIGQLVQNKNGKILGTDIKAENPLNLDTSFRYNDQFLIKDIADIKNNYLKLYNNIIAKYSGMSSSNSAFFSASTEFQSYRQLYMLTVDKFPDVDKLILGKKYYEQDRKAKGVIYELKLEAFDIAIPTSDFYSDALHLSMVSFGKHLLLIVESEAEKTAINSFVNALLNKQPLNPDQKSLIDKANFYCVNLATKEITKGKENVVDKYIASAESKEYYPLWTFYSTANNSRKIKLKYDIR